MYIYQHQKKIYSSSNNNVTLTNFYLEYFSGEIVYFRGIFNVVVEKSVKRSTNTKVTSWDLKICWRKELYNINQIKKNVSISIYL